jgi:hypothetical protein
MPPLNTQKQQQELFDEFVVVKKTRGRFFGVLNKFNKPIFQQHCLSLSVSYEILIMALIGVVLVASIIFALGVERGRSLNSSEVEMPVPIQPVVAAPDPEPAAPVVLAPKPAEAVKPAADKPYTIQVALYKTRELADRENSRIKGMGYSTDIIKKGSYYILCVGSFVSKDAAKQTFATLEKKYKGCLIRKR